MPRLTNPIRSEIVKSLVRATFKARGDVLAKEQAALSFQVRDAFLGDFKDQYLTLPNHLQEHSTYMHVHLGRLGEKHDNFHFHFHAQVNLIPYYGEQVRWSRGCSMTSKQTEPTGKPHCIPRQTFKKALLTKLVSHADRWEDFENDVKKLSNKVSEQLRACTTTEKLTNAWPEISQYVPTAMNPLTVVIDRKKTNDMIACMVKGTCG